MATRILIWATVLCLGLGSGCGGAQTEAAAVRNIVSDAPDAEPAPISRDATVSLSIENVAGFAELLNSNERREQLADWALAGVLSLYNLDAQGFAQSLGSPLFRLPAWEEVGAYQYDLGRHAVLPNGNWLFVVPSGTKDARQVVGRLADTLRNKQGEIAPFATVYRYTPKLSEGKIEIVRAEQVVGKVLFSSEYNYVETSVHSLGELQQWLEKADDLAHIALVESGGITLGGRDYDKTATSKISLEEIATMYQAYAKAIGPHFERQRVVRQINKISASAAKLSDAYHRYIKSHVMDKGVDCKAFDEVQKEIIGSNPELELAFQSTCLDTMLDIKTTALDVHNAIISKANEKLAHYSSTLNGMPNEPVAIPRLGFSLDPFWNTGSLLRDLKSLRDNPEKLHAEAKKIIGTASAEEVRTQGSSSPLAFAAIVADDPVPNIKPTGDVRRTLDELISIVASYSGASVLELPAFTKFNRVLTADNSQRRELHNLVIFVGQKNKIQCARYDGDLKGTSVGMNLFYTDLIAKLWVSLDYKHSAPFAEVPGLPSSFYSKRADTVMASTRLWLGPKLSAINRSDDSSHISFEHVVTKIFSAASDPAHPGREVAAAEADRSALGWWSNHFAEIASYDPEYYRLNQLQKWSLATSWLVSQDLLSELSSFSPSRGSRFDVWSQKSENLRFGQMVDVLPQNRWVVQDNYFECINVLAREQPKSILAGGVSLAGFEFLDIGESSQATAAKASSGLNHTSETKGDQFVTTTSVAQGKLAKKTSQAGSLAATYTGPSKGKRPTSEQRGIDQNPAQHEPIIVASFFAEESRLAAKITNHAALDSQKTFRDKNKGANIDQIYDAPDPISIEYDIIGLNNHESESSSNILAALGKQRKGSEATQETLPATWQGKEVSNKELSSFVRDAAMGAPVVIYVDTPLYDRWNNGAVLGGLQSAAKTVTQKVVSSNWPQNKTAVLRDKTRYIRFNETPMPSAEGYTVVLIDSVFAD